MDCGLLSKDTFMSVLYSSIYNETTACLHLAEDVAEYRPNSGIYGALSMIVQPVFFHSYCTYSIYQLSCNLEKRFSSIALTIVDLRF